MASKSGSSWFWIFAVFVFAVGAFNYASRTSNYSPPNSTHPSSALPVPSSTVKSVSPRPEIAVAEPLPVNPTQTLASVRPTQASQLPEPTTATPLGTGDIREVTATVLNVRGDPTLTGRVVTTLAHGQHVTALGDSNGWVLLSLPNGLFGWANGSYLGRIGGDVVPTAVDSAPTTQTAELQPAANAPPAPSPPPNVYVPPKSSPPPWCSETGSCYGDISSITGLPKTTF